MIQNSSSMDRPVSNKGWTTKRKLSVALLVVAIASILLLAPRIRRWASAEMSVDASRIRIGTVERGDLVREVSVQGNVIAAFSPTLVSPARGSAHVSARAGEVVEAGTELLRIKSPEVDSRLEQERSALLSLQADLERQQVQAKQSRQRNEDAIALREVETEAARRALGRQEKLRAEGLTNDVQYEEAQDALKVSETQLRGAREQIRFDLETLDFELRDRRSRVERQRLVTRELERQVEELIIRAPVSGLVSRVQVSDRDTVAASQPLVTVVDLSAFEVEAPVPEAYADEITPGLPALVTYNGRQWPAKVRSIAPEVEGSRVPVVVVFDGEAPEGLKQNQRVTTTLVLDTRTDVLKVQRGPFLEAGGGRTAYVLNDGMAERRPIEIGALSVSEIELVSGLEPGDQIVLSDTGRFKDAERVLVN